jgi:hypothetical protein
MEAGAVTLVARMNIRFDRLASQPASAHSWLFFWGMRAPSQLGVGYTHKN